jgi:hypothetical protein
LEGGWEKYIPSERDIGREMILRGHSIKRQDIPTYFTYENMQRIEFFWKYKTLGLPFSGGWAEQPAYLVDIIIALETEIGKRNG